MVTNQVNLDEVKEKLIEKLKVSGWSNKLKGFILSSDFTDILNTLHDLRNEDKRFTPPLKYVFRAFEECPLNNLKVVVLGQDPYPQIGVADGIAFSCGLTGKLQPSLRYIFHAVNKTVYDDNPIEQNPDLKRWANQGILMLNTALTCQIDKIGSHIPIWKNFVAYLIDMLNNTNSGLIFVLLGKQSQEYEALIEDHHYVLKASHPASAAYAGGKWDCNNIFNKINDILEKNNGKDFKIQW